MSRQHVAVASLSPYLRDALADVKYGARDIAVEAAETVWIGSFASAGQRTFATLVDMSTGKRSTLVGSWGGPGLGSRGNAVDLDREHHTLPPNAVMIHGNMGYPRTFATIYAPPALMGGFLPAPSAELTRGQRDALYCHRSIKGGEYRREEMRRRHVTADDVDAMVTAGFLTRNRAGAVSITTIGKNAIADYRGY